MFLVLPALSLNYLGQGSLLLENPSSINNPFYLLAPEAFIYPLVFLSVIATIIASQAVISGLFSLTWQAIMLHYLPRMKVIHTSINQIGQIYVPAINYTLCILSIIAVLIFRSSESLASAYGLSVASVMLISTIFVTLLSHYQWKWHIAKTCLVFIPLTCLDLTFVATSFSKIFQGAWYTLAIASIVIYIILVWIRGNEALKRFKNKDRQNLTTYLANYLEEYPTRIPGCCLFMSRSFNKAPYSLEIQLKHNKFLHEKALFLAITTEDIPQVSNKDKYSFEEIMPNIFAIKARFGFYEEPNLYKIITWVKSQELINKAEKISFFLSRGIATAAEGGVLSGFSEKLYIFLSKNALPAYEFFKIKDKNVVELGVRYKI